MSKKPVNFRVLTAITAFGQYPVKVSRCTLVAKRFLTANTMVKLT